MFYLNGSSLFSLMPLEHNVPETSNINTTYDDPGVIFNIGYFAFVFESLGTLGILDWPQVTFGFSVTGSFVVRFLWNTANTISLLIFRIRFSSSV